MKLPKTDLHEKLCGSGSIRVEEQKDEAICRRTLEAGDYSGQPCGDMQHFGH